MSLCKLNEALNKMSDKDFGRLIEWSNSYPEKMQKCIAAIEDEDDVVQLMNNILYGRYVPSKTKIEKE